MDYVCCYGTPLGEVTLASDGEALIGLWFVGQRHFASRLAPDAQVKPELPVFGMTKHWLDIYFSGREPDFTPPVVLRGTPFMRDIWGILREIPYGQTVCYGAVAAEVARRRGVPRMSARAAGGAVARNPVSVIVPCHRVTGADGGLGGYAGGTGRKAALLALENALPAGTGKRRG